MKQEADWVGPEPLKLRDGWGSRAIVSMAAEVRSSTVFTYTWEP